MPPTYSVINSPIQIHRCAYPVPFSTQNSQICRCSFSRCLTVRSWNCFVLHISWVSFPPTPCLPKGGHTCEDSRGSGILEEILNLGLSVFRSIFLLLLLLPAATSPDILLRETITHYSFKVALLSVLCSHSALTYKQSVLHRLRVPHSFIVKLENNQASLTSQNTKVDAKAIYTLETASLKREEEREEEEEGDEKGR